MSDSATPLVYEWDVLDGPCGVSRDRDESLGAFVDALREAQGATEGDVREVELGPMGGYVPVRTIAHVERTAYGALIWTDGS